MDQAKQEEEKIWCKRNALPTWPIVKACTMHWPAIQWNRELEIIENSEDQNFHLFSTTATIKPF
jgi:hypothetical protein